jgi:hypothetical protein
MKICTNCKIEKDFSEFYETLKGSGKYKALCRECDRNYQNERNRKKAELKKAAEIVEEDEVESKYTLCRDRVIAILELYHGGKKKNC